MKNVILLWVVFFVSCSSSKVFTSGVSPYEINEMIKFQPLSFISLIEKWDNGVYNEAISEDAKVVLDESLTSFSRRLRLLPEDILMIDDDERKEFEMEVDFLISTAERNKKKNEIPIPPLIESLLSEFDMRFGLIVLQEGYTRSKRNYHNQVALSVGLGILTGIATGYSTYQTPIKASSTIYSIIVDNQEKNVAFFNKSVFQGKEPTDPATITKQLNAIFLKYLW